MLLVIVVMCIFIIQARASFSAHAFLCMFISFHCRGFSWLNIAIMLMPEFSSAIVCRGNIPVSRTFGLCVKDKRVSIKSGKATTCKTTFKKASRKKCETWIPSYSLTSEAVLTQHKANIVEPTRHREGLFLLEEALLI